jgi:hypothetical protein
MCVTAPHWIGAGRVWKSMSSSTKPGLEDSLSLPGQTSRDGKRGTSRVRRFQDYPFPRGSGKCFLRRSTMCTWGVFTRFPVSVHGGDLPYILDCGRACTLPQPLTDPLA